MNPTNLLTFNGWVEGKKNTKPSTFSLNMGLPCKFSLRPIHWNAHLAGYLVAHGELTFQTLGLAQADVALHLRGIGRDRCRFRPRSQQDPPGTLLALGFWGSWLDFGYFWMVLSPPHPWKHWRMMGCLDPGNHPQTKPNLKDLVKYCSLASPGWFFFGRGFLSVGSSVGEGMEIS